MKSNFHVILIKILVSFLFCLTLSNNLIIAEDELEKKSFNEILKEAEEILIKLENIKSGLRKDAVSKIKDYTQFLRKTIDKENRLDVSITTAISGDETFIGKQNYPNENLKSLVEEEKKSEMLSKIQIESEIKKGGYPSSFRINLGTNIIFQNSGVLEELTKIKIDGHHYLANWVKIYGFAERTSDSYLSLRHRFEIGAGFNLETELNHFPKKIKQEHYIYRDTKKSIETNKTNLINAIKQTTEDTTNHLINRLIKLITELSSRQKDILRIENAYKKQYSIMKFGFGVAFLSEIEKAEIDTKLYYLTETDGEEIIKLMKDSVKFQLDAEQKYRCVLSPSIQIMPFESVTITGLFSYKIPLSSPIKVENTYDSRYNLLLQAKYDLEIKSWAKGISLILEFNRQYDNTPPKIPQLERTKYIDDYASINNLETKNCVFGWISANKTHDKFQFKLLLKF